MRQITFYLGLSVLSISSLAKDLDAHAIWASPNSDGAIHYACYCDRQWSGPKTISQSDNLALAPAIVNTSDGMVVFWVELSANSLKKPFVSELEANGGWTTPVEIKTDVKSTSAIAGIVDNDGQLWLSWSGNDWDLKGIAMTSDIYAGRFDNGQIVSIERVHPADKLSDLMPRIAIDGLTEKPVVSWLVLDPSKPTPLIKNAIRHDNGWQSVGLGTIEASFDSPATSSNTVTGIVPLSSLDLPVPDFINPQDDQIAILFKDIPNE